VDGVAKFLMFGLRFKFCSVPVFTEVDSSCAIFINSSDNKGSVFLIKDAALNNFSKFILLFYKKLPKNIKKNDLYCVGKVYIINTN
jgi:hypothetical protein